MPGRILIVDDVATNRFLIKTKLTAAYYEVMSAANGVQGVTIARGAQPDLILLDVNLPDMSGITVCEQLKSDPVTADIPIVMITAGGAGHIRVAALDAGADDFLLKPLDERTLLARVRSLMRMKLVIDELRIRDETGAALEIGSMQQERPSHGLAAERLTGRRVMVVPNDPDVPQDWIGVARSKLGLAIEVGQNMSTVLNTVAINAPDALIIHRDVFGGEDGLRLIAKLRADRQARGSAILLTCGADDQETAALGLDVGANDYIQEPFDPMEMVARLRLQLRRKVFSDRLRSSVRDGLRLAVIDPLTGVHNRRYLRNHLSSTFREGRHHGGNLIVLIMDIDRFKAVNDQHGHSAGDSVLCEFAARLTDNVRGVDLVSRIGGEEFCLVMPDTDLDTATRTAERLRRAICEQPFRLANGASLDITVSIGVSASTGKELDPEELLDAADRALYASKHAGRNRVTLAGAA